MSEVAFVARIAGDMLLVALTLAGMVLFYLQISKQWMNAAAGWWLLLSAFVGCLGLSIVLLGKYRNQGWLVDQIEHGYPELDQRLVTTLGEIKKNNGKPLGYLQHTVLLETVAHAHHNGWSNRYSNSNRTLDSMMSQYRYIDLELKELSNDIRSYCKKYHKKDYMLLRSVPGIAGLTAGYILSEIGDIRRFSSLKKFASYIGFIPRMSQSGEGFCFTTFAFLICYL